MTSELDEILRIGREAAALVRDVYKAGFTVELKGPDDPVTRADREANTLICERLAAAFPGDAIVAEESAPDDIDVLSALVRRERVFYVDPLDGTREFANRNGEFAVMIGLAVRGRAELGVLVLPVTGEAIAGSIDASSTSASEEGDQVRVIQPTFIEESSGARRPLRVSTVSDATLATMMVSRSHRPPLIDPLAAKLKVARTLPCGSVGVKVARVVTGEADLYVHDGLGAKRWDSCAPEAVLLAAGGLFTDLDGALVDYASPDLAIRRGLVASNAALHGEVLSAVRALEQRKASS